MNDANGTMRLVKSSGGHIREIMGWFPDRQSCTNWGGPAMRFPFTEESFLEDIHWGKLPSYCAVGPEDELLGFGQFYEKLGRCHLARLAIAPEFRGRGLGKDFISSLMNISSNELGYSEFSLYVLEFNNAAVACYQSLGFRRADIPEAVIDLKDCIFMITAFD
jgi:ribosomal protein S18 acetylase RimI-like enzyme